jgi:hypothetical protein
MDCLKHYRIQLDFEARKMRFLNRDQLNPAELGQAFALTNSGNLPLLNHVSLAGTNSTLMLIDSGYDIDGQIAKGPVRVTNDWQIVHLPERVWHETTYTNLAVRQADDNRCVLGLRFLARHLVTFDFPSQTMYLKQMRVGPIDDEDVTEAIKFLKNLKNTGQLPGGRKGEKGSIMPIRTQLPEFLALRKSVIHPSITTN